MAIIKTMYNHRLIEKKWQEIWDQTKAFATTENKTKKFYVLDMFPYPSGEGLHVGHPEGYTATDIIARYKRLNNFDVLHPMGWDAFGLPAEQYALKTGNHPEKFTQKNIATFKRQLKSLGFSYDYDKEINTTDPLFYTQTQWIFTKLYEMGLAQIRDIEVNWCQKLGTVLANEEVLTLEDGKRVSERGHFLVTKKPMKQWVLKITKYADRLYDDLNEVDWPQSLINLQRNWIRNPDGSLHLRDWVFSRQRYWGEPFPIAYDQNRNVKVIKDLPVQLPFLEKIVSSGTGESPLINAKEWLNVKIDNKIYQRETHTMPQWAGSSWYYLAYILKNSDGSYEKLDSPSAKKRFAKWLPVDLYVGGQEHAVLHLLYARFWHKVLYDLKIVATKEPFLKMVNQGMILGSDGQKMSKSLGNVINPDTIIRDFGADTLRVYEMFMGPLEDTKKWNTNAINGIRKWLDRVYLLLTNINIDYSFDESIYHQFIKEITNDIEDLKFNVAISKMMVFINNLSKQKTISLQQLTGFCVVLSLFAPHLSEEILSLHHQNPIKDQSWPHFDQAKIILSSKSTIALQVNGKLRATLELNGFKSEEEITKLALENNNVKKYLGKQTIKKIIYISNKILNIVTN